MLDISIVHKNTKQLIQSSAHGKNKMKDINFEKKTLCICVSGQFRGDINSIHKLRDRVNELSCCFDVSVIFSLWNKPGKKNMGAMHFEQLPRVFEKDASLLIPYDFYGPDFWSHLPSALQKIEYETLYDFPCDLKKVFPQAIFDYEEEVLDLSIENKPNDNSKKMLYKIWRCNELKKSLERTNDKKFDYVMRLRPDINLKILSIDNMQSLTNDALYLPNIKPNTKRYYDVIALGSSLNMDKYSDFFSQTFSNHDWLNVHIDLFKYLNKNVKKIKCLNGFIKVGALFATSHLTVKDLQKDNPFFRIALDVMDDSFEKENFQMIDEMFLSPQEKCSIYLYLANYFFEKENFKYSLKALVKADITERKNLKIVHARERFIAKLLAGLVFNINPNELQLTKLVSGDNESHVSLNVFNIQENKIYKQELNKLFFKFINDGRFVTSDELSIAISHLYVDENVINQLRDLAIIHEESNLMLSYRLMSVASENRPNGPLIRKKMHQYKERSYLSSDSSMDD